MLNKNDIIDLTVTGYSTEGYGVGKYDTMAVFVPFTAIGDKLKVRILKNKKTYAYGKIEEIIEPSNDRIENDCKAFTKCGGCSFRHISYECEAKLKEQRVIDAFKRIAHIDIEPEKILSAENACRYRNKAQYPVGKDDKVKLGFFAPHSHRIVEAADCKLQPECFEEILNTVRNWIEKNNISVYNEETHSGLIRHIYLREGRKTGEILFCLVINGRKIPKENELINALEKFENIKSIMLNINTKDTNVILSDKFVNLKGDGYIEDILCGLKFRISPLSFYQVNAHQAQRLYEKAAEFADLKGDEILLDLYCGTGTIGLTMAHKVKSLIGVEIVEDAIKDAKINARLNGINNARFICADASKAAQKLFDEGIKPDVIVIDPPRKGCSKDVLETINNFNPERIVYVSCDPATLARDCRILTDLGYTVKKVCPCDMFPRTAHVETVVQLSRKTPDTYIDIKIDLV